MRKAFDLTKAAKADLRGIAIFTQKEWGREQRNVYLKQFDDAFHMLADTPLVGKACDNIKAGFKKFPIGSHVIFYRENSKSSIVIVRILHKLKDVDLSFQDS